uniref:Uncharacterized protein n=1 Tax=Anguilla anguilla TaxID=7936 RepID=A0A0E9RP99_ANGAN
MRKINGAYKIMVVNSLSVYTGLKKGFGMNIFLSIC